MKQRSLPSHLGSSVLACSLVIGFLAPGCRALAQSPKLTATIPFSFRSGSEVMPAGRYEITKPLDNCVLLRRTDMQNGQMLPTQKTQAASLPDHSKLLFHRYGDQYFLYQIWTDGRMGGSEFLKSRAEKELLHAAKKPVATQSEIALNQKSIP